MGSICWTRRPKAGPGRAGEVRFFGEVDASDTIMRHVIQGIATKFDICISYEVARAAVVSAVRPMDGGRPVADPEEACDQ